ncbi:hypothetical protein ABHF33_10985 [Chitinibacter sp. FCG-7]|uniref:DUF3077 domain-containing protein n=1 Tax=Chitinibacter mangrovi TaxID=3153927 RepID=A0AAU7F6X3_9NEIS
MRKPIDLEQLVSVTDAAASALLNEPATSSECSIEVCLICALDCLERNQRDPESRYNALMALDYLRSVVAAVRKIKLNGGASHD